MDWNDSDNNSYNFSTVVTVTVVLITVAITDKTEASGPNGEVQEDAAKLHPAK